MKGGRDSAASARGKRMCRIGGLEERGRKVKGREGFCNVSASNKHVNFSNDS